MSHQTAFLVRPMDRALAVLFNVIWKPFAYDRDKEQWRPWALRAPNALTLARLIGGAPIAAAFVWSMWTAPTGPATVAETWLFWSFVAIMLTDQIDGPLAHYMQCVSDWGKKWDPIADKPTVGAAFIGLALLTGQMTGVAATVLRGLLVTAVVIDVTLYVLAWRHDVHGKRLGGGEHAAQASPPGRWKFALYCAGLAAAGISIVWNPAWLNAIGGLWVAVACFAAGVPLAVWSFTHHWKQLQKLRRAEKGPVA